MALKKLIFSLSILFLVSCTTQTSYQPYQFDNGDDYVRDGMARVVDQQGRIGYVDVNGVVRIKPRFACAFPFENGKAKVTDEGKIQSVAGSNNEYHYCESHHWYYIDKSGRKLQSEEEIRE